MSDKNNNTSIYCNISDRNREIISTAALVATGVADIICERAITPRGHKKSGRDESAYLDRVLSQVIDRQDYGALPHFFNDTERLKNLSADASIEQESDFHLQTGLMVMQAAFAGLTGASPLLDDENLEFQLVRETMAATQFHIGMLYNLSPSRLRDICTFMRGVVETAYEHSSWPGPALYVDSVISAINRNAIDEIELHSRFEKPASLGQYRHPAVRGLSAASTMFDALYHMPGTPFEDLKFVIPERDAKGSRKQIAPEWVARARLIL